MLNVIASGSLAEAKGLTLGDCLLRVNGIDVTDASHDDVVRIIASAPGLLKVTVIHRDYYESKIGVAYDSDSSSSDENPVGGNGQSRHHSRPKVLTPVAAGRAYRSDRHISGGHARGKSDSGKYHPRPGPPARNALPPAPSRDPMRDPYTSNNYYNRELRADDAHVHQRHLPDPPKGSYHSYRSGPAPVPVRGRRSMKMRQPSPLKQTKHTIITREVRLGLENPVVETEYGPSSLGDAYFNYDDVASDQETDIAKKETSKVQVVVRYAGSVEMPRDPKVPSNRLHSIRNAVQRLRASQKSHTMVMMEADCDGIRLLDLDLCVLANYRTNRVAFCGTSPDDDRFFGIVTIQISAESMDGSSRRGGDIPQVTGSSCHVFMVDPDICHHADHAQVAVRFGIRCTRDVDRNRCFEFLPTAGPIIGSIGRLYRRRQDISSSSSDTNQLGALARSSFAPPMPKHRDDRSRSGSSEREERERRKRVFVVDTDRSYRCRGEDGYRGGGGDGAERAPPLLPHECSTRSLTADILDLSAISTAAGSLPYSTTYDYCTDEDPYLDYLAQGHSEHRDVQQRRDNRSEPHVVPGRTGSDWVAGGTLDRLKVRAMPDPVWCANPQDKISKSAVDISNHPKAVGNRPVSVPVQDFRDAESIMFFGGSDNGSLRISASHSNLDPLSPPPPPLPPRQSAVVNRNSSTATVFQNLAGGDFVPVVSSRPPAGLVMRPTSPGLHRSSPIIFNGINPQSSSTKPPLPERRPVLARPMRTPLLPPTSVLKDFTRAERSKSTPPLKTASGDLSTSSHYDKAYESDAEDVDDSGERDAMDTTHASHAAGDESRRCSEGGKQVSVIIISL